MFDIILLYTIERFEILARKPSHVEQIRTSQKIKIILSTLSNKLVREQMLSMAERKTFPTLRKIGFIQDPDHSADECKCSRMLVYRKDSSLFTTFRLVCAIDMREGEIEQIYQLVVLIVSYCFVFSLTVQANASEKRR